MAAAGVPAFDHIFVILMENHAYSEIIGNTGQAPFINQLADQHGLATDYFAISHPSLPNYLALVGGSTFGISTDCNACYVNAPNLTADRVARSGRSWRGYMESMPDTCHLGDAYPYIQHHDPFVYFDDIRTTSACGNVVPFGSFTTDLALASTTPHFVWITPNMCDDMHDCSISTGDAWLQSTVTTILTSPAYTLQHSLVLITWDEDDGSQSNHVATLVIAKDVPAGFKSATRYDHYSLLATIEQAWGLAPLTGNDTNATSMSDFFTVAMPISTSTPTTTATSTPSASPTHTPTPIDTPTSTSTPTTAATPTPAPTTNETLPGAPTNVTAVPDVRAAIVSWQPPTSTGGCTVTSYTVTASPGETSATVTGDSTSLTLDLGGPSFKETYTFTVAATNCVGTGPTSAPSNPITPLHHP